VSEHSDAFGGRLLKLVCQYDYVLYLAFVLEVMLLLFGLMSFLFAELDEETETILILDFILLGGLLVGTLSLIYVCKRRILAPK
jgi:hypothetical protein